MKNTALKSLTVFVVLFAVCAISTVSVAAVTFTATPDTVLADGQSQVEISLFALDMKNRPLADKTITFSATQGTLTETEVVTNSEGCAYTMLIADTEPGEVIITASHKSRSIKTMVNFVAPPSEDPCPNKKIFSLLGYGVPTESLLQNESVSGISIRASWNAIEAQEGIFDWGAIDNLISQADMYGKKVSITIIPGIDAPEWVYDKGAKKFDFINRNSWLPSYGEEMYCPMPWDDIFLTSWENFIKAFATKYEQNPTVSWIRITGPMNTVTAEWNLQSIEDWEKYEGTEDEFSDAKLIAAIKTVIDKFALEFQTKLLSIAIAKTKITDTRPFLTAATEITDYGFAIYPDRFNFQVNGWKNNLPDPAVSVTDTELIKEYAPSVGAQMVWSATDDPYCRMNNKIEPCNPYTSLAGAVETAIDYNLSFLEIYAEDVVNPDLQDILDMFCQ
jgi:hypothetical protein